MQVCVKILFSCEALSCTMFKLLLSILPFPVFNLDLICLSAQDSSSFVQIQCIMLHSGIVLSDF